MGELLATEDHPINPTCRAGGQLRTLLGKLTANRAMGMLTGLLVTAVIQSSSATTVMVVG